MPRRRILSDPAGQQHVVIFPVSLPEHGNLAPARELDVFRCAARHPVSDADARSLADADRARPGRTRRRVLMLTSTLPRSAGDGTPRFVLDLAERIAAAHDVVVLAPHARGTALHETIGAVTVRRFRYLPSRLQALAYGGGIAENLRNNRWLYLAVPFFFAAQVLAIARLLSRERFDLVHAHWWVPQALAAVVARCASRRRVPIVCTLHGADVFAFGRGAMRHLLAWVLLRCRIVCPVSGAVGDALPAAVLNRSEISIAPMGVDLERKFRPDEGVERRPGEVAFVGRLVAKKGVEWLLHAFARAAAQAPELDLRLRVIGDGPLRVRCEALVEELGLASRVRFEGTLSHDRLPPLLTAAAIAVVPSVVASSGDREGLGLTAIEAQGCDCAVVVSDTPSLAGIVEDGRTGLVVPQGDVAALAAALISLGRDANLRSVLARAGREAALRAFSWPASVGRYIEVYERALAPELERRG